MADLAQEMADVKAAIDQVVAAQKPAPAPVAPAPPGKVYLRHPHTNQVVLVAATSAALTPYMVQGFVQYTPTGSAKE
jgi:hypothetical protein